VVAQDKLGSIPKPCARSIGVADTFVALKQLAPKFAKPGRENAGVTGSVGKTTTKEILAALLGTRLRIFEVEGNFNNEYGLPLTLFKLDETHEAAVLEMGCRGGRSWRDLRKLRAGCRIVTRVSPAHLEFFSSVDEIALAKREFD